MRRARILYKNQDAGILTQRDDGSFLFRYHDDWFSDENKPAICLTMPKTQQEYQSKYLFSTFFSFMPEGFNKQTVCKYQKIDKDDYFGILLTTAKYDTIGALRVIKIDDQ